MSGTGFPSGSGLDDPAAWAVPVQPGVPDTRQVPAEPTDTQMLAAAISVIAAWDKLHGSVKYTPGVGDMMEDIEFREMQALRAAIAAAMKEYP
jgi:hypothetical protein